MAYREDYERATGRTRWREDHAFNTGGCVQNGPLIGEGTVFGNFGDSTVFEFWENSTTNTDNKTNINLQNEFKASMTEVDEFSEVQNLIAETCDEIKNLLLEKNRKYGNSALDPRRIFSKADAIEQIKVRIDDKLNRIANQQSDEDEDVVQDLMGYLVLLRVAHKLRQLEEESASWGCDGDDCCDDVASEETLQDTFERVMEEIEKTNPYQPQTPQPWIPQPPYDPWKYPQPLYPIWTYNIYNDGHSVRSDVEDEYNEYTRGEGELT